jgi:hypothetical protein
VLAAQRCHDRLIIDAGIGHQHAEGECGDGTALECRHRHALAEPAINRKIDAPRVGDGRHAYPTLRPGRRGEAFEKAHPGFAQ